MSKSKKLKKPVLPDFKNMSFEELERYVLSCMSTGLEKRTLIEKFTNEVLPILRDGKVPTEEQQKLMNNVGKLESLKNHTFMLEGVAIDDRAYSLEFVNRIIEEYDCKTASEIATAQLATISYLRYIRLSNISILRMTPQYLSTEKASFLNVYTKEMDRAYRQYMTATQKLDRKKNPPLKVSVKTKNAFISQNQQINHNKDVTAINASE